MTKTLDLTKPVQTRDGKPVRILCTDRKANTSTDFVVVGLLDHGDFECVEVWGLNGNYETSGIHHLDLVNVPQEVEKWMNIFISTDGKYLNTTLFDSREEALYNICGADREQAVTVSVKFTV